MHRSKKLLAGPAVALALGVATLAPAAATADETRVVTAVAAEAGKRGPAVNIGSWVSSVVYGEKKVVKGSLKGKGKARKVVMLQRKLPGGSWTAVAKDRTNRKGKYELKVATKFLTPGIAHRVAVKRGDTSKARKIAVKPNYAVAAPASAHAPIDHRYHFQYDPCKPITYRVNLNGMDASALADTKTAVRRLEIASGLRFKYLGSTSIVAFDGRDNHPRDTNLIVSWATDAETVESFTNASAWGGTEKAVWARSPRFGKVAKNTKTGVVVNKEATWITPGADTPRSDVGYTLSRVQLLQHELGHAAGLGHVLDNPGQIMSYNAGYNWGAGDLTGLSRGGMTSGCLKPYNGRAGYSPEAELPGTPTLH